MAGKRKLKDNGDRTLGGVAIRDVKITDKQKKAVANIKKNDNKKKK